jgi:redox-sensitive bicupin YhaK (pirin superfamily)
MSFFPGKDPLPGDRVASDQIEHLIIPRTSDLGGFEVRRALPSIQRRMVGPFIFFDRMGPAQLTPENAFDVRPHPHIGLSTVTYLFEGHMAHRDSLGTAMVISPGDLNLMTSGRGIVHSERTPDDERAKTRALSGVQTWLALPDGQEEVDPAFFHADAGALPQFASEGISGRVIIGSFAGLKAPVPVPSETLYVDLHLAAHSACPFDVIAEERAAYILEGAVTIGGVTHTENQLLVFRPGDRITLRTGSAPCHMMLFGGDAVGSPRHIWWNFVSSSKERIEQAKEEWKTGRFDIVPGDEEEFIPLPV